MSDTDLVEETEERDAADHLDDVSDGCGCAEIWEHLSERRARDEDGTGTGTGTETG
jgi:hypothetical protein